MKKEQYKEQIEESKKWVAKSINTLEAAHGKLEFVFEQRRDWNNEIKYQLEEAVCTLGMVLATLTNWYDEEEGNENE